jgi:hypothetical protein
MVSPSSFAPDEQSRTTWEQLIESAGLPADGAVWICKVTTTASSLKQLFEIQSVGESSLVMTSAVNPVASFEDTPWANQFFSADVFGRYARAWD